MPELTQESVSDAISIISGFSWMDVILILVSLVIGLVAIRLLSRMLARLFSQGDKLDLSLQKFLLRVVRIILYFILIIICAGQVGIPINSLLTILASLGLAVSLAVQDTLKNVAGGIFVLSSKPFGTGDYIGIGAVSGVVEEIGIIHTTLVTPDNKKIIVPNSKLTGEIVTNHTRMATRRLDVTLSVPLESDLAIAKQAIADALAAQEHILEEPAPTVQVWEVGAASYDLSIQVWCAGANLLELRGLLLLSLKRAMEDAGIAAKAIKAAL